MSLMYKGQPLANAALGTTDAEAYAVGTRDGVDVVSSDKTYNNNAKYYAELAKNQATQIAESVQQVEENAEAAQLAETNCEQYSRGVSQYAETARHSAQEAVDASMSAEQSSSTALTAAEEAKQAAELAQAVTGVKVASSTQLGVVRGGDNHISEDGTLQLLNRTTDNKLENCYAGRLLIHELRGNTYQDNSERPSVTTPKDITKSILSAITTKNNDGTLESSISLSSPIFLNGMNDVYDIFSESRKTIVRRFQEQIFDGSDDEGWVLYDEGWLFSPLLITKVRIPDTEDIVPNMMCSIATVTSSSNLLNSEDNIAISTNGNLNIYNSYSNDLDGWKAYLQSNPMTVVYECVDEVIENLPTVDLVSLYNLKTFNGTTDIETDSDVEVIIESEYGTSSIGALTILTYNLVNDLSVTIGNNT